MKILRSAVAIVSFVLLGGGYFVSQAAYFSGTTGNLIKALDASSVPLLSLLLLVTACVLLVLPKKGMSQE